MNCFKFVLILGLICFANQSFGAPAVFHINGKWTDINEGYNGRMLDEQARHINTRNMYGTEIYKDGVLVTGDERERGEAILLQREQSRREFELMKMMYQMELNRVDHSLPSHPDYHRMFNWQPRYHFNSGF